jgi:hypothetical protein
MNNNFKNSRFLLPSSSFTVYCIASILLLTAIVACQNKKQSQQDKPTTKASAINMCEFLNQQEVEKIFGVEINNVKNSVQSAAADGQSFATQCTYYVKSNAYKTVAIMLKYSAKSKNPKTFDELLELNTPKMVPQDEAQKKILDEAKNSFLEGKKINDIGDVGIWYNYAAIPSLILYFKDHYQLIINLTGFDYTDNNFEGSKKIADKVLQTIK